jgi:DNA-binding transcriptional MerR regulator
MGGAAGHMAHPFDCREVRNGQDLINFYVKAVNAIPLYEEESKGSSVSIKLDGVNTSFRLQKADNPAGFMFVIDRGGKTPGQWTKYDFEGVTPDNVVQRFKGNEDHGMVQVVNHMSKILNHDLMKLRPYVEALGLFERMGPEGVFFDAEYYANADPEEGPNAERGYKPVKNNVIYNHNYIAIHRLSEFYTETSETKTGKIKKRRLSRGFYWETVAEINELLKQKDQLLSQRQDTAEIDQLIAQKNNELKVKKQEHQEVLDQLAKAIQEHTDELDMGFKVYTKIGLRFKQGLTREAVLSRIEEALNMKVPYNYLKISDKESVGPTAINEVTGEVESRTLKQLLLSIDQNPAHVAYYPDTPGFTKDGESVKGRIQTKPGYIKDPKQSAFALQIYEDVMVTGPETGIGPFDIGNSPEDAKAINSATILWHAVRYIGDTIKKSIVADVDMGVEGGDEKHEGLVIQSTEICDGIAFKFTGEFIVDNRAGGFGVTPKGEDIPSNSAEAMFETKIRYGKLIKEFQEQEEQSGRKSEYVILIPGGFKPPTGGHYSMIKYYDDQPDVRKVIVVTGPKGRNGVTLDQSKEIFSLYGGFSDKVEFAPTTHFSPTTACYETVKKPEFVRQYPNAYFSIGASDKGKDKKRIKDFVNYFEERPHLIEAEVWAYPEAKAHEVGGKPASASRMMKAFVEQDWETFKSLLPNPALYDDVVKILSNQTGGEVNENFTDTNYLFSLVEEALSGPVPTPVPGAPEQKPATGTVSPEQENQLRAKIANMAKNSMIQFVSHILNNIPEVGGKKEKEEVGNAIVATLVDALTNQLMDATKNNQSVELAEMSSMAGGAVEGTAGGPWPNLRSEEDED